MRPPEAGELQHRVQVRRRADHAQRDGPGLESEFIPVASRWAKIEPLGTATYQGTVQTGNVFTHRIYFRYVRGLDARHEIVEGGQVFRVKRPSTIAGRNVWSVVEVEEVQSGAVEAGEVIDDEFRFR
ncbi:head-tail adaptor protein [Pseudomonas sp. MSSRFD41]|uniref:head-tail adaptor protein n=1 Tax=Pseudomonas sp. MSSRFD41 TaxID=1310370 RepID=UPI00163AAF3D|nr:head-tail adaptor protein [Pseudomonas sp. MSSRFD41]MBC2655089.1 head-tail adaptor protein [Pseudomonas sp. MSSRFD41]